MILDAIILDNFGAFRGRQQALLTPENDKPIILFGGMNGGGKTTLLDAVQLAFYGPKARLSNRGRLGYREYLRESIHHGSDPREGAGITVRFRRTIGGEVRRFELQRNWHEEAKGIEESVRVLCNDVIDEVLTEHWEQTIETYLPSGIAHLFFFDGEQIRELAEGDHAAEILGTAVHSLLGLDLVDRLEADLKVFERRKRAEGLDREAAQRFAEARSEFEQIDRELEKAAMQEGVLVNEAGRLGKELRAKEDLFRSEGGELYLRRNDLETELNGLRTQKKYLESQFRELVAGPLPLVLVEDLLGEVEKLAQHEAEVKRASLLLDALEARDREILASLRTEKLADEPIQKITRILEVDRCGRVGFKEPLIGGIWSVRPQKRILQRMKPPVETLRISKQGRDQLAKLRRHTGIENWNVLCRWAFCVSMKEETPPQPVTQRLDGGVEMTWKVFAGQQSEVFSVLIIMRARNDGFPHNPEGVAECLRAHIHRGLAYLASGKNTRSLIDLVEMVLNCKPKA